MQLPIMYTQFTALGESRRLIAHRDQNGTHVDSWPEVLHESARAIAHLMGRGHPLPGRVAYDITADLRGALYRLEEAMRRMCERMEDPQALVGVEDSAGEPADSVRMAVAKLRVAAVCLAMAAQGVDGAQCDLAGHSIPNLDDTDTTPSEHEVSAVAGWLDDLDLMDLPGATSCPQCGCAPILPDEDHDCEQQYED